MLGKHARKLMRESRVCRIKMWLTPCQFRGTQGDLRNSKIKQTVRNQ